MFGTDDELAAFSIHPEDAWRRRMFRRYVAGVRPSSEPQAVFVAGPPSAGKSLVVDELCRWFADNGHCVVLDAQELRIQHPGFAALLIGTPTHTSESLREDAERLADELLDAAIALRQSLVIETRAGNPAMVADQAERLLAEGYRTTLIGVCATREECQAGLAERDEFWLEAVGITDPFDELDWDEANQQYLRTLYALEQNQAIDEWHFIDRQGREQPMPLENDRESSEGLTQCADENQIPTDETTLTSVGTNNSSAIAVELPLANVPITSGGRQVRLGTFHTPQIESTTTHRQNREPVAAVVSEATTVFRGVRLGQFSAPTESPSTPASSVTVGSLATVASQATTPITTVTNSETNPLLERRRRLQEKLRRRAGPSQSEPTT